MVVFIAIRIPALSVSFGGAGHSAYDPNLSNISRNVLYYFAFPFIWDLNELINIVFTTPLGLTVAALLHVALLAAARFALGPGWVLWCLVGYFLFLGPILLLPKLSSHYLYASGISMSVLLATVLVNAWRKRSFVIWVFLLGLTTVLLGHSFNTHPFLSERLVRSGFPAVS